MPDCPRSRFECAWPYMGARGPCQARHKFLCIHLVTIMTSMFRMHRLPLVCLAYFTHTHAQLLGHKWRLFSKLQGMQPRCFVGVDLDSWHSRMTYDNTMYWLVWWFSSLQEEIVSNGLSYLPSLLTPGRATPPTGQSCDTLMYCITS